MSSWKFEEGISDTKWGTLAGATGLDISFGTYGARLLVQKLHFPFTANHLLQFPRISTNNKKISLHSGRPAITKTSSPTKLSLLINTNK